jgi:hypothetical protein
LRSLPSLAPDFDMILIVRSPEVPSRLYFSITLPFASVIFPAIAFNACGRLLGGSCGSQPFRDFQGPDNARPFPFRADIDRFLFHLLNIFAGFGKWSKLSRNANGRLMGVGVCGERIRRGDARR